jgi:hypothetical protein
MAPRSRRWLAELPNKRVDFDTKWDTGFRPEPKDATHVSSDETINLLRDAELCTQPE